MDVPCARPALKAADVPHERVDQNGPGALTPPRRSGALHFLTAAEESRKRTARTVLRTALGIAVVLSAVVAASGARPDSTAGQSSTRCSTR